jgi:SAM-dependent methyltransferase
MKLAATATGTSFGAQTKDSVQMHPLTIVAGFDNVTFRREDISWLSFADETFDHIFVCFVLEHLDDPVAALVELKRVLKTGGTITVIEGDHGSCFWHPETPESIAAWNGLIDHDELVRLQPERRRRQYQRFL